MLAVWVFIQSTSKDRTMSTSALRSSAMPRMRMRLPVLDARTLPERARKPSISSISVAGLM